MKQQKQQQKLQALIRDLERELSEGKCQVEALEETHKRLQETERICQELADENRRLGEEITGWQERFAESEENQRQVSLLRQQLDALQAEHTRVIDSHRQTQEQRTERERAGGLASAVVAHSGNTMTGQSQNPSVAAVSPDSATFKDEGGDLSGDRGPAAQSDGVTQTEASAIAWGSLPGNSRLGLAFAGVMILVIAGVLTLSNFTSDTPKALDPVGFGAEATAIETVAEPVSKPSTKTAPRVRGAFQTIMPTQVFRGPSEDSELITQIGKGTKVNVVDSREGWLEIRSKHGRPPGFIRQEAAVRFSSN